MSLSELDWENTGTSSDETTKSNSLVGWFSPNPDKPTSTRWHCLALSSICLLPMVIQNVNSLCICYRYNPGTLWILWWGYLAEAFVAILSITFIMLPNPMCRILGLGICLMSNLETMALFLPCLLQPQLLVTDHISAFGILSFISYCVVWPGCALSFWLGPKVVRFEVQHARAVSTRLPALYSSPRQLVSLSKPTNFYCFIRWSTLMSPMLLLGIFLIANFFLSMKFNFDLSGAQALLRIIFQLFSLSLLIIGLHGGVQVRLLVYGALVYLAWEIVLPWLGWEFWKERGKFNSFFFGYLPDYNGVMMSAWFSFILVLMVISTLRALRCLRSDLVQMSVNPTPEIPEEEFARPGWDQAEK